MFFVKHKVQYRDKKENAHLINRNLIKTLFRRSQHTPTVQRHGNKWDIQRNKSDKRRRSGVPGTLPHSGHAQGVTHGATSDSSKKYRSRSIRASRACQQEQSTESTQYCTPHLTHYSGQNPKMILVLKKRYIFVKNRNKTLGKIQYCTAVMFS